MTLSLIRLSAPLVALGFSLTAPATAQDMVPDIPPPAPPAPVSIETAREASAPEETPAYSIYARVMGGERELWAGNLALTVYGSAMVRMDVQDMDSNCPVRNNRFAMRSNNVELKIRPGRRSGETLYSVEVTWTRPSESCDQQGSKATGFDLQVELTDNETRVIEGDGGLRVELTRRP